MRKRTLPILHILNKWHKHYEEAILNAGRVAQFIDRAYIYDNSVDNQEAQLLFKAVDGKFSKQYVSTIPQWTETIFEKIK